MRILTMHNVSKLKKTVRQNTSDKISMMPKNKNDLGDGCC